MANIDEIRALEEQLRQAELGPEPEFFASALADDALLDGQLLKSKVVEAHRPGQGQKFTKVEMTEFRFFDHGSAVALTCTGHYEGERGAFTMKFMRVWAKKDARWQIIAAQTLA